MKLTKRLLSLSIALLVAVTCLSFFIQPANASDLLSPPVLQSIQTASSTSANSIIIRWSHDRNGTEIEKYEIQYAKDSGFTDSTKTISVSGLANSFTMGQKLEPGTKYYFRIRAFYVYKPVSGSSDGSTIVGITRPTAWSGTKTFNYQLIPPIISSFKITPSLLNISLQERSNCDGYEVECCSDSSYNAIVHSWTLENKSSFAMKSHDLEPTKPYYFRARSYVEISGEKYYSSWTTKTYAYTIDAPSDLNITKSGNKVTASWNSVGGAPKFLLQVSDTRSFDKILFETHLNNSSYTWDREFATDKAYYIRVKSYKEDEQYGSAWSEICEFKYTMTPPKLNTVKQASMYEFVASWTQGDSCDYYELQYSTDRKFDASKTTTVIVGNENNYPFYLVNIGTYYTRIRACHTVGAFGYMGATNYSEWSNVLSFDVGKPATPVVSTVGVNDNSIVFSLQQTSICDGYEIEYSKNSTFAESKKTIVSTDSQSIKIPNDITPGVRHYFRIRAFAYGDPMVQSDWSEVKTATYRLRPTYIKSLSISNGSILATWSTSSAYSGYQIQYGNEQNFSDGEIMSIYNSNESSCYISGVKPGVVFARIRAVKTVDGKDYYSEWSNTKNITFRLEKTYITNMYQVEDKIKVAWKPINSCSGYIIECVYGDGSYGSLEETEANTKRITVDGGSSSSAYIEGLKPGSYNVRIRACVTSGESQHMSEWSNYKTAKVTIEKTYIKTIRVSNGSVIMNWKPVSGCDGYEIKYYNDRIDEAPITIYAHDAVNNEYTMKLPISSGFLGFKIRAFDTVDGVKYYSAWSNTKIISYNLEKTYLTNQYVTKNACAVVAWKKVESCSGYNLEIATNPNFVNSKSITLKNPEITKTDIDGVTPSTIYFRIRTYYDFDGQKLYTNWSNVKTAVYKLPIPTIQNLSVNYNKLNVAWAKMTAGTGYEIQYSKDARFEQSPKTVKVTNPNATSQNLDVEPGTVYVRMRSYWTTDGTTYHSDWSNVKSYTFSIKKPSIVSGSVNSKGVVSLSWMISNGCHGYQIQCSEDSNFVNDVKNMNVSGTNINSATINVDIPTQSMYYMRIRAYKVVNGVKCYSDWTTFSTRVVQ